MPSDAVECVPFPSLLLELLLKKAGKRLKAAGGSWTVHQLHEQLRKGYYMAAPGIFSTY